MGAVFASNIKAYGKWQRAIARSEGKTVGLTGASLESAVRHLASTNPEYVVVGG